MRIQRRWIFLSAALLISAIAIFGVLHREKKPSPQNEILMLAGQDQRVLHDLKHSSDREIYGALVRAAKRGQPEAFSIAHQLADNPSPLIKRAVIRALGFSEMKEPWIISAFDEALGGSDPSLRQEALSSLGEKPGSIRVQKLESFLKSKNASPQDKITAYASLYNISGSAAEKHATLSSLLSITGASYPTEIRKSALSQALFLAPRAPEVTSSIRQLLASDSLPEAWPIIFRRLAVADKSLADQLFGRLIDDAKPEIRTAAIRMIPVFCPKNRWNVILSAYQRETKDEAIQAVLSAILEMPGSSAEEALLRLSGDMKLDSKKRQRAHETLILLRKSSNAQKDPCAHTAGELHPPGFTDSR